MLFASHSAALALQPQPVLDQPPEDQPNGHAYYKKVLTNNAENLLVTRLNPDSDIADVIRAHAMSGDTEDAFFVADLGDVARKIVQWAQLLPRVEPFYAVKCNPDHQVVSILASLGTGFDCASKAEMRQVLDLGVSPDRIIYAHPCKPASHLALRGRKRCCHDDI